MKTLIIFLTFFLSQCNNQSKNFQGKEINIPINQAISLNDQYEIIFEAVTADSRCPEGVNCVWMGQVEINVAIYKKGTFIEKKELKITHSTQEENKKWFSSFFDEGRKIKEINVLPERIKDQTIVNNEYLLQIIFEE